MNKIKLICLFSVTVSTLLMYCNSKTDIGQNPNVPGTSGTSVRVTLDENSSITSKTLLGGLFGDTLTIDSGTTFLQRDEDNEFLPISPSSVVILYLNSGDTSASLTPPGMKRAVSFGISATVNGERAEIIFAPPHKTKTAGMPYTGAHFTIQIADTGISDGALLLLYKISSDLQLTCIGSSAVNTPVKVLSKVREDSDPGVTADASPDGTGNYNITYHYSPILNSTPSTMPENGVYWTEYTNIPETTYVVGGQTFGGPLFVGAVSIGEPSTTELMADVCFADGVNCVTYTNPHDNVQFWVERTQNTEGKTTALKVASNVANIPYLNLILYSAETGRTISIVYGLKPNGGVHAPDGSILTDPYSDPSLKIGGCKLLNFRVKNFNDGSDVRRYVQASGYDCSSFRYDHGVYQFNITLTQDSRALIEENVLSKENWFPVKSLSFGNVGVYEKCDSLTLNITSHADEDTVSTQKITLSGTITNPAYKTSPVTSVRIYLSSGTESKQIDATVISDSLFSAEFDLYVGMNILAFIPMGKTESGTDINYTKCIVKAKEERISSMMLTYAASWTGRFELTRTITSTAHEPDTSISVSVIKIASDMKFDFRASKLWYIKQSHENAVTCSELDNCNLFSGYNSGPVSVNVSSESKTKNCDDELPLVTMSEGSGEATLDKYSLNISATLTPWDSSDVSTERRYHLSIFAGPEFSIHTDSNWPKAKSKSYDCLMKEWRSDSSKIGPTINLDEEEDVLKFSNSEELELYSDSPVTAKSWTFTGNRVSDDGLSVEEYSATLSIQP